MSDATEFVFKISNEDDSGGDPAPSVTPGAATRARDERDDRGQVRTGKKPTGRRDDAASPSSTKPADRQATAGDIIATVAKGLDGLPVLGRLVQVGSSIVLPLVNLANAINELRRITAARNSAAGFRATAGAASAARDTVLGAKVAGAAARAADANQGRTEFQDFLRGIGKARRDPNVIDLPSRDPDAPRPAPGRALALRPNVPRVPPVGGAAAARAAGGAIVRAPATAAAEGGAAAAAAAGGGMLSGAAMVAAVALPVIAAVAGTVLAIKALVARSDALVERLGNYSGALAQSVGRTEVARVRQDLKSARYLGPDLSKYNDATSRMGIALDQILDALTKAGLETLQPTLDGIATTLELIAGSSKELGDGAKFGFRQLTGDIPGMLGDLVDKLRKLQQKEQDKSRGKDTELFLSLGDIPDLELDDVSNSPAGFPRKNVHFGGIGGPQLELP